MKHDLEYKKYKKYELKYGTKKLFDDSFKIMSPYSYSHRFKFKNNYGASVIKHYGSYGFEEDLFELAVLDFHNSVIGDLAYDTPIADDVLGYLTNDQVLDYLEQIKNL